MNRTERNADLAVFEISREVRFIRMTRGLPLAFRR